MFRNLLNALSLLDKSNLKGAIGESVTRSNLAKLNTKEYRVINNVTLELSSGKTTQIDHIVVSIYGIFVIETKNYKGFIFGKESDQNWTQAFSQQSFSFYNPIKQNQGHIYSLKGLLKGYGDIPYFSVISFAPQAQLKVKVKSDNAFVIYMSQLKRLIKRTSNRVVLTIEEVEKIVEKIEEKNKKGLKVRSEHISNTRSKVKGKKKKIKSGVCPECGSSLVSRTGPYGSFLGCSNYPRCTFKQKS